MTHATLANHSHPFMHSAQVLAALQTHGPGLVLSAVLAGVAMVLGEGSWLQNHGLSALTLAILLGMALGNTVYARLQPRCDAGVAVSKQQLLRLGIVLYGLRLTLQDIGHVGLAGVLIDALVLGSTFALACVLGIRWLKLEHKAAMLIGAGSAICGAAAVLATEPVLRARTEQVTVAVATVVALGTVAIFLYPALYVLNTHLQLIGGGAHGFGLYAGSTIHEVAQVLAAAHSVGSTAADTAVITKMVRVMMLAPFLILLSAWLTRDQGGAHPTGLQAGQPSARSHITIPWFAFVFMAVVVVNSFQCLPRPVVAMATTLDTALLAMAMAALGLTTHVSAIRKAGLKPLLLALMLFVWLVVGGALINHGVQALF